MAMDILNRLGSQPDQASVRPSAVKPTSNVGQASAPEGVRDTKAAPALESVAPVKGAAGAHQPDAVKGAVKQLNAAVQSVRRELEFSVDEDSGRTIVKVTDSETGDVIRQMPAEEALEVSRHIKAFVESRGSTETGGQSEEALGIIMKVQA